MLKVFGGILKVIGVFRGAAFLVGVSWDGAGTVLLREIIKQRQGGGRYIGIYIYTHRGI